MSLPVAFFQFSGWGLLNWLVLAVIVLTAVLPERFVPAFARHPAFQAAAFFALSLLLLMLSSMPVLDWAMLMLGLAALTEVAPKYTRGSRPDMRRFIFKLIGATLALLVVSLAMIVLVQSA
jgi:hypothetical protein